MARLPTIDARETGFVRLRVNDFLGVVMPSRAANFDTFEVLIWLGFDFARFLFTGFILFGINLLAGCYPPFDLEALAPLSHGPMPRFPRSQARSLAYKA